MRGLVGKSSLKFMGEGKKECCCKRGRPIILENNAAGFTKKRRDPRREEVSKFGKGTVPEPKPWMA